MSRKRILFLQRAHPDDVRARESLDAALVAAVFDQSVAVLFRDDGVLQLMADASTPGRQALSTAVASLPEYGVEAIYACRRGLLERNVDVATLRLPVRVIDVAEQGDLIAAQQAVVND